MEGRYFAHSNGVPSIVLDDDVQVVPYVHDLPDHGWCESLHDRFQVGRNLPQIRLSKGRRRLLSLDIVELRDLQSNLNFLLGVCLANIIRDLDLLDVLLILRNFPIVAES